MTTEKTETEPCHECEGTGWFTPTGCRDHGWSCRCCAGTGKLPAGTYQALRDRYAEQQASTPPPASLPEQD